MASTVNTAFDEFLKDTVRLYSKETDTARASRDNLISNINGFSGDDDFFTLFPKRHLMFGSFARRTKIRPLDDIDLMICLSAEGRSYTKSGGTFYIYGLNNDISNDLTTQNGIYLNSTKVINRFIKKLGSLNDYSKAEMHKNKEAATLKLRSYDWNYDIVPCWHMDIDKYLIPDGKGNWKLSDPRIDNSRTAELNQKHKGKLLDVIRIMKYWNSRAVTYTIDSYPLECMILDIYENIPTKDNYWVDLEFKDLLKALSNKIMFNLNDPKGIQGNLNSFSSTERATISKVLFDAHLKAIEAGKFESEGNQKSAILTWRKVLGPDFPDYS